MGTSVATQEDIEERALVIGSSYEELSAVEAFIDQLNDAYSLSPDVYDKIIICVTEAVNNGILHGNKFDERKRVEIRAQMLSSYILRITVKDDGNGFDPAGLKDPTAPENRLMEHGRGVFMINQLADVVKYHKQGSVVEMQFNI